jgi:hypothetical protein
MAFILCFARGFLSNGVVTLLLALVLMQSGVRMAPVSDGDREPSFRNYVQKLKVAVGKRDPKLLRKLVADDVIVGGFAEKDEKGYAKFAARWEVDQKEGAVWDVLADLIELGFFRQVPTTYVSPYVAWKFPRDLDPRLHLVVLRDALPLRAAPQRDAAVVATLAFDVVRKLDSSKVGEAFDWVHVETMAGVQGYVQAAVVRSPLMAKGQFSQISGQWKLLVLDRAKN